MHAGGVSGGGGGGYGKKDPLEVRTTRAEQNQNSCDCKTVMVKHFVYCTKTKGPCSLLIGHVTAKAKKCFEIFQVHKSTLNETYSCFAIYKLIRPDQL